LSGRCANIFVPDNAGVSSPESFPR
jgi:hypothetical protein